jgi:hypothetical protein
MGAWLVLGIVYCKDGAPMALKGFDFLAGSASVGILSHSTSSSRRLGRGVARA